MLDLTIADLEVLERSLIRSQRSLRNTATRRAREERDSISDLLARVQQELSTVPLVSVTVGSASSTRPEGEA